ncbi:hypothetical protein GGR56DRAFT_661827 [Xylariaceae sp. FL0804]|nr:hypothetical protein GGR56DRAFT_661827 [Xylariaceae sp. FL0804]
MVRAFSTLDSTHFCVDQKISIYLHQEGHNWTLFIWTDASKDLTEFPTNPWGASTSTERDVRRAPAEPQMQPVLRYKPMLALKSHRIFDDESNRQRIGHFKIAQTASTLHLNYGRSLRPERMSFDPLYALREVFELVAQAEIQFLNLCASRLSVFEDSRYTQDPDCLPNLKNLHQSLYKHLDLTREALSSLHTIGDTKWPKASDDSLRQKSKVQAQELVRDLSQLLRLNEELHGLHRGN